MRFHTIIIVVLLTVGFLALGTPVPTARAETTHATINPFQEGREAYNRKDWAKAILLLRPLAEQGDSRAMVLLGNMHARGYGVVRNDAEAFRLYHRAARTGEVEAMVVTAAHLQQGLGVAMDVNRAFAWYEAAALRGNPSGALFYGLFLFRGNAAPDGTVTIPSEPERAYQWLRIAARLSREDNLRRAADRFSIAVGDQLDEAVRAKAQAAADVWTVPVEKDLPPLPE